jgi:hypothetical protein
LILLPRRRGEIRTGTLDDKSNPNLRRRSLKLHVLLALAALVVGFTVPALAQQKEPPLSEQDYQKLLAMGKKNDEAWSKSDAAALVALYTDDAVFVTPSAIPVRQRGDREALSGRF